MPSYQEKPPTKEELLSLYIFFKELAQIISDLEHTTAVFETVLKEVTRIAKCDIKESQGREIFSSIFARLSNIDLVLIELTEIKNLREFLQALSIRDDQWLTPLVALVLIRDYLMQIEHTLEDRYSKTIIVRSPLLQLNATVETLIEMAQSAIEV